MRRDVTTGSTLAIGLRPKGIVSVHEIQSGLQKHPMRLVLRVTATEHQQCDFQPAGTQEGSQANAMQAGKFAASGSTCTMTADG